MRGRIWTLRKTSKKKKQKSRNTLRFVKNKSEYWLPWQGSIDAKSNDNEFWLYLLVAFCSRFEPLAFRLFDHKRSGPFRSVGFIQIDRETDSFLRRWGIGGIHVGRLVKSANLKAPRSTCPFLSRNSFGGRLFQACYNNVKNVGFFNFASSFFHD
jgi:hypothetical protein